MRVIIAFIHRRVQLLRDRFVILAGVPAQITARIKLVERVGARRIDHGKARDLFDQPQLLQLHKRLAERRAVAQIPAGHDHPIRRLPVAGFQNSIHDRLLPLQAERVYAVHHVNADVRPIGADLADAAHAVVEIAFDLQRQRAVIQRLR